MIKPVEFNTEEFKKRILCLFENPKILSFAKAVVDEIDRINRHISCELYEYNKGLKELRKPITQKIDQILSQSINSDRFPCDLGFSRGETLEIFFRETTRDLLRLKRELEAEKVKEEMEQKELIDTCEDKRSRLLFNEQKALEIDSAFICYLKKLKRELSKSSYPTVYLAYAWPTDKQRCKEDGIQPFLRSLHSSLKKVGFPFVFLDIVSNHHGANINKTIKGARTSDYVILFGTESLLEKYENGVSVVCTELIHILIKRENDNKSDASRVLPILLSGSLRSSFPAEFERFTTIRDWRNQSYLHNFQALLVELLHKEDCFHSYLDIYKKIWKKLTLKTPCTVPFGWYQDRKDDAYKYKLKGNKKKCLRIPTSHTQCEDVFPSLRCFFGRAHEMKNLHKKIQESSRVAVVGLGGVGKTSLCRRYISLYSNYYKFIHVIKEDSVESDLLKLAEKFKIFSEESSVKLKLLREHLLKEEKPYLLFFDGVDSDEEFEYIRNWFPKTAKFILVTSRRLNTAKCSFFEIFELGPLTENEAVEYLTKCTQHKDKRCARTLAQKLGCLPIALKHAVRYVDKAKITFQTYLDCLDESGVEIFGDIDKNEKAVFSTWVVSLNRIINHHNAAFGKDLLRLFAFFGQAPIPSKLIQACGEDFSKTKNEVMRALMRLLDYSLITAVELSYYQVHPIIQEFAKYELSCEEKKSYFSIALKSIARLFALNSNAQLRDRKFCNELCSHANALIEFSKGMIEETVYDENIQHMIVLLDHMSLHFYYEGRYFEAKTFGELSLEKKEIFMDNNEFLADSFRILGRIHKALGSSHKALEYLEKELKVLKKQEVRNSQQVAKCLNNIGMVLFKLGYLGDALEYLYSSLDLKVGIFGDDHPITAATVNDIGLVQSELGEEKQALENLHKAYEIRKKSPDRNHREIADSLINIGLIMRKIGSYEKSLEFLEKAQRLYVSVLGNDHPDVATCLSSVGGVYSDLGKFSKAIKLLKKALKIQVKCLGDDHPDVAKTQIDICFVSNVLKTETAASLRKRTEPNFIQNDSRELSCKARERSTFSEDIALRMDQRVGQVQLRASQLT